MIRCWSSVLLAWLILGFLWGQPLLDAAPCALSELCFTEPLTTSFTEHEWDSEPIQVAQLIQRRQQSQPAPSQDTPSVTPQTSTPAADGERSPTSSVFKRRPEPVPDPPQEAPKSEPGFAPIEDRWRIQKFKDKYRDNLLNPYQRSVLKGDYPIHGQHLFFILTGISDTLAEFRELPIPAGISTDRPDSAEFFGRNNQIFFRQNILLRFELIEGNTAFKPPDWIFALTPAFNVNYVDLEEVGIVNPDVRDGTTRLRTDIALQEAFFEYHLTNINDRYDFISAKVGIQPFNSDFRSFLFFDTNLSARLFGTAANNRFQYNLLYFNMLEKETNSELNTFGRRDQHIAIANLYWQDFIWLGYTTQFSLHYNYDKASFHFDANDFLVRPDPAGSFTPHDIHVGYLGWTSDGHIGRLNVNHAFYLAIGKDEHNPIAGRSQDIFGQMFALELSVDFDWLRPKLSVFWSSGDKDPEDDRATGFDSIFDKPNFAGGGFSFWNRQGVRLLGVGLVQRESLIPNLRSSKIEGQVNFVNPGLLLLHAGLDVEATPKLRTFFNFIYLRFVHTQPIEIFLQQPDIGHNIGFDLSVGALYRPLLNNNIMITAGAAAFVPGDGFRDSLTGDTLFQGFVNVILTY